MTELIPPEQRGKSNFLQETLATLDREAPLTVDVLATLMQAQSDFLIAAFNKQLSQRDTIINQQRHEIKQLKEENTELRAELDELQQYSRRNSVRISGIPEASNERPQELYNTVTKLLAEDMKVDLIDRDFCRMHRIGQLTVMPTANGKVNRG